MTMKAMNTSEILLPATHKMTIDGAEYSPDAIGQKILNACRQVARVARERICFQYGDEGCEWAGAKSAKATHHAYSMGCSNRSYPIRIFRNALGGATVEIVFPWK